MMRQSGVSERRACREIGMARSSARYLAKVNTADKEVMDKIKILSKTYPRFGYRRIGVMLEWKYGIRANPKKYIVCGPGWDCNCPKRGPKENGPVPIP